MMGPSKAFDPNRFFILCANVAGSPYGTVSPLSINPDTGEPYGPSFPPTSIRDDILCVSHPFLLIYDPQLTVLKKAFTSMCWTIWASPPSRL